MIFLYAIPVLCLVLILVLVLNKLNNRQSTATTTTTSSQNITTPATSTTTTTIPNTDNAVLGASIDASGVTTVTTQGFENITEEFTSSSTKIKTEKEIREDKRKENKPKQATRLLQNKSRFTEMANIRNNIDTYFKTYCVLIDTDYINDELKKRTTFTMQEIANNSRLSNKYFMNVFNKINRTQKDYSGLVYGLEDPKPFFHNVLNILLMRKLQNNNNRCDYYYPEKNTDPNDMIIYTGKCISNNTLLLSEISKLDNATTIDGEVIDLERSTLTKTSMRKAMKNNLSRYFNITNDTDFNNKITSLVNDRENIIQTMENDIINIFERIFNSQEADETEEDRTPGTSSSSTSSSSTTTTTTSSSTTTNI